MKHIIFDLDGTLWDTTTLFAHSWNRAIKQVGGTSAVISAELLKREFGKPMDVIANRLFADATEANRQALLLQCCHNEHEDIAASQDNFLYPHVVDTLKQLHARAKLYIVSNCQAGYIELFIEKIGLSSYISDIECFGNTGKSKGENIKLLMKRNQLTDAIYVGDTQGDYEASCYAGIPFVFASYGFGQPEGYWKAINSIDELLALV